MSKLTAEANAVPLSKGREMRYFIIWWIIYVVIWGGFMFAISEQVGPPQENLALSFVGMITSLVFTHIICDWAFHSKKGADR